MSPFLKGLLVLAIGSFFIVALNKTVPEPVLICMELLIGLAPIYLPVLGIVRKLQKHNKIKAQITASEAKLVESQRIYNETEAYLEKNAEVDIPRRFRDEVALDYIIRGLKAREFVSLDQAFFRCEEKLGITDYDL